MIREKRPIISGRRQGFKEVNREMVSSGTPVVVVE